MEERSFEAHLFDLPDDIVFEVMKYLDIDSLQAIGKTCKFLKLKLQEFECNFPEYMARARMYKLAAIQNRFGDSNSDDSDGNWLNDEDDLSDPYDYAEELLHHRVDDMLDNISYGSNYDEELDDYYNRPL